MRITTTTLITALATAATVAGHLQLSLSRPQYTGAIAGRDAQKRQNVDTDLKRPVAMYSSYYPYAVDVTVGTPGQPQTLPLTFSYPASFVLNQTICHDPVEFGSVYFDTCAMGAYDASKSSSFARETSDLSEYDLYIQNYNQFYDVYGARLAAGSLMTETVRVGGEEVTDVRLGLVNDTLLANGFMGLGYSKDDEDGSLLTQMADQGVINSRAFSMWADDQGNNVTGSILFGAVDKSKYTGKLQRLQASAFKDGEYYYNTPGYAVNVTAAEGTDGNLLNSSTDWNNFYATISPTTMITNLPAELAEPIWEMANASYRYHWGGHAVDCNATDSMEGTFTLELGGAGGYRLEVNVRDLVLSPEVWWEQEAWNLDEERAAITWCYFGVQSVDDTYLFNHDSTEPWVIGNMALQNTYMVFDADNMEVGLAPLKSDLSGDADIESFSGSSSAMPDSEFAGYKECFDTVWGCDDDDNDDGDGDGSNGWNDDDYYSDYDDAVREYRRQVGIIVGAVLGAVAMIILGLSVWAVLRCRRIRKAEAAAASKQDGVFDYPGLPMAMPVKPQPTYAAQQLPVVHENAAPQEATRQEYPEADNVQTVSPMSTPRAPEATLAREPPATTSDQGAR